jgi:hypothetical protein
MSANLAYSAGINIFPVILFNDIRVKTTVM